jgi:tetratricopeptide (TPR) repeat protein
VLLYQLLVGALPFEGTRLREAGLLELLRIIREEDPPTPSNRLAGLTDAAVVAANRHTDPASLRRQLTSDLSWIVLKAIEKDKNRRYASASDVAADIRRYLTDQPVGARPPSASYHLRKFARRHRRLVASATAVFVALVGGVIASTLQAVRAMRAEAAAVVERDSALAADQANTKAMNRVLSSLLNQIPAIVESGFAQKLLEQLAYEGPFTHELLAQAATERAVSSAYRDLGQWANAQRHLEAALRLWLSAPKDPLSTLGFRAENTPAALSTMTELASVYEAQGNFSNAEPLLRNVFETERRLLGDWHPETLHYEVNLAYFYYFQWRLKEAESLFREVLEILRNHNYHGYEPEKLGGSVVLLLAAVLQDQGKYPQAEPLLNRMLQGQGKYAPAEPRLYKGDESPEYRRTKQQYSAIVLDRMGRQRLLQHRYTEAEKLLREAHEQHSQIYGDDWVIHSIESLLGKSLAAQRRYSEAEQFLISGYEGMLHLRDEKVLYISYLQPIYRIGLNRAGDRVVQLYRDWGKPQKVAQWQARIKTNNTAYPTLAPDPYQ